MTDSTAVCWFEREGLAGMELGVGSKVKMPLNSSSDVFKLRPATVVPLGDWTERFVSLRGRDPLVLILHKANKKTRKIKKEIIKMTNAYTPHGAVYHHFLVTVRRPITDQQSETIRYQLRDWNTSTALSMFLTFLSNLQLRRWTEPIFLYRAIPGC